MCTVVASKFNNSGSTFFNPYTCVCVKQSDINTDTCTRQKYLLVGFLFPIRGYKDNLNGYGVMAVG